MKNCAEIMMNCAGIILHTGIGNDDINSKTVLQKIN